MTSRVYKSILLLASIVIVNSWDAWTIGTEPKYIESIVVAFNEYDSAEAVLTKSADEYGYIQRYDISIDYQINRIVKYDTSSEKDKLWFKSKCDKYGDNHYNQNIVDKNTPTYSCTIPDINAIHVTSEEAFDNDHPKGVFIDDCFDIYYKDLKNIIESDYSILSSRVNTKPLNTITKDDMSMLTSSTAAKIVAEPLEINGSMIGNGGYFSLFGLKATKLPTGPSVQHLNIEFKTEYGNTISCPIEFDFSQSMLARNK